MNKYFRDNARPVALIPALDQQDGHAQLWSDDKHLAVVHVPAGSLVAQASLAVDLLYEGKRKETEKRANCPVVSIAGLKPDAIAFDQVKQHFDTHALRYGGITYVRCERSAQGGDTIGMTVTPVSADDARIALLFAMKRGLARGDWGPIDSALTEADREAVKNYGERHWLQTWGLALAIVVIVPIATWLLTVYQKR